MKKTLLWGRIEKRMVFPGSRVKSSQNPHLIVFLIIFLLFLFSDTQTYALEVPLTVKETAGVGADGYPVTAVVPLPFGQYRDPNIFRIIDASGNTVPAQFNVLNRWWGKDNSIRHLLIHFQPTIPPFTSPGTGVASYFLRDDGLGNPTSTGLSVTETSTDITVVTGPLKFTVKKTGFNLFNELWLDQNNNGVFEASEQIIMANAQNGGKFVGRLAGDIQLDSSLSSTTVQVEESGPMRVIIRAEAPTIYNSTTDHKHGFAVRIYAYVGKPFVKVDYQLQNSAKNKAYAWPLYFEEMNLELRLNLVTNPTVRFGLGNGSVYQRSAGNGLYLAQEFHNSFKIYDLATGGVLSSGSQPEGFIDVSDGSRGVTAMIRNFWQMWPNGLEVDGQNKLSLQLFPRWSAQWYQDQISPIGLYWLEDMQHVYKETMLYFHGTSSSTTELINLAKTFQYYPVVTLPTNWYQQTQVTLDLGGVIPYTQKISTNDQRQLTYPLNAYTVGDTTYQFNWVNFGDRDLYRKRSCQTGGWPYGLGAWIVTENPSDYFALEERAIGELNLRKQWMAQYIHDQDWNFLRLTENPYCEGAWRRFDGWSVPRMDAPYLSGSGGPVWYARDNEHGWFYHVDEAYNLTGNPWIKDWYRFIAEFRRTSLERLDPVPDRSSRALGHSLNHALQAYKATGDTSILTRFKDHIRNFLRPDQDPGYGDQLSSVESTGGGFQTGYLARALIDYLEEVRGEDWQAYAEGFNYLSGLMEWNYHYGNFSYFYDARTGKRKDSNTGSYGTYSAGTVPSDGTGLTLVDPEAWYYWHTGKQKYWNHVTQYVIGGLNGGARPYGNFTTWSGQFEGRYYLFVKNTPRPDTTPPPAITDLKAVISGSSILLTWTAPAVPDLARYHIVWSTKPISETSTPDTSVTNWWAAKAVGPNLIPNPGTQQSLVINPSSATPFYAAIFTFDQADNMSAMSNVAQATSSPVPTPVPTSTPTPAPTATSTPTPTPSPADITPPTLFNITLTALTSSGVTINWNTSEVSDTQVEYGVMTAYGQSTSVNPTLTLSHSQILSNLIPNTLYHYRVKSRDAAGNLAISSDLTFTTLGTSTGTVYTVDATATPAGNVYNSLSSLLATKKLVGGDIVQIRSTGIYKDRIVLTGNHSGTPGNPVIIRGIDPTRAVWDGTNVNVDTYGYLWKFDSTSHDIELQHIEIRNVQPGPDKNNRAVYILGTNITLRDCYIHHNPNGIFSYLPATNTVIEGCEVAYNGVDGFEHNFYMQGIGTHIRFNYIHDAIGGINIKDRSLPDSQGIAVEVAYNHISHAQQGGYELDFSGNPSAGGVAQNALVIGNIIEKGSTGNQSLLILFGNDGRQGTLQMYNNTLIALSNTTPLFTLTGSASASVINNIYYGSTKVSSGNTTGTIQGQSNWFQTGTVVPTGFTDTILGTNPGFVDMVNKDYHLTPGASVVDAGIIPPVVPQWQYVTEQSFTVRPVNGNGIDIGAYEADSIPSTPTSTPIPTATPPLVPTPISTPVPTPIPTATPTPTPKVKSKPRPKSTPTPVPTATLTPVPTATPIPVPTITQALIPVSNPVNPSAPDSPSLQTAQSWGIAGDIPMPADYDGDNKADLAVFRPFDGNWYLLLSSSTSPFIQPWGVLGDQPVTGDYDGDKKADFAVFRSSTGTWFIQKSSGGTLMKRFGKALDIPVSGDYDGDGLTDLAVFRPSTGIWRIKPSRGGAVVTRVWGQSGDIPVPADYDGDKITDLAIWRPTEGKWYIQLSTGGFSILSWGQMGDLPVVGDYDGDGFTDIGIFKPASGEWEIKFSSREVTVKEPLGRKGDVPVPADYDGDGRTDRAVWRPTEGKWYLDH